MMHWSKEVHSIGYERKRTCFAFLPISAYYGHKGGSETFWLEQVEVLTAYENPTKSKEIG